MTCRNCNKTTDYGCAGPGSFRCKVSGKVLKEWDHFCQEGEKDEGKVQNLRDVHVQGDTYE